ncbi:site-2 protease family protein [Salarchaeum japonicum]|uniref:Site-2 protease family protein n=1 Tax=Salarchaeum japonicum TaxID=555573 RepID=A0AAV3SZ74_9EURY|nr:site-2 protease family protein [Salarchaeum japonicum]
MNEWTWVLAGVLAYWVAVVVARNRGLLPDYVNTMGPLLTVHTKRGKRLLDRLARPKRAWRAWGNFGLGIALVVLVGAFALLATTAIALVQNPPATASAVGNPRSALVVPGVNPFLPVAVAPEIVLGLFVGLVVHEGGHGVMSRVEGIGVESMGVVLLAILPMGAFVEPDQEEQRLVSRGSRARMFAAGVTNNFLVALLAFGLLLGPVASGIAVAPGAAVGGVTEQSPAAQAGIEPGDRIVAVGNESIASNEEFEDVLANHTGHAVSMTLASGETVTVNRSVLVTGVPAAGSALAAATPFSPDNGVSTGDTIVSVNGTSVETEAAFRDAVTDATIATVTTASGNTTTGPVGALATLVGGEPFAEQTGLASGDSVVVTRLDGERVVTYEGVSDALADTTPGDSVTVEYYVEGERYEASVTLGENPNSDIGFLGVQGSPGYSGMTVSDAGIELYPAGFYLDVLGGDLSGASLTQSAMFLVFLPFLAAVGLGVPYNFPGFVPDNAAFYTTTGVLEPLGGTGLLLANALFWVGWVNINLGFFNCIPGYPLDGGHLLRTSVESVVSRLPVEDKRSAVRAVTTSVGLAMLACLLLMLFPNLLV